MKLPLGKFLGKRRPDQTVDAEKAVEAGLPAVPNVSPAAAEQPITPSHNEALRAALADGRTVTGQKQVFTHETPASATTPKAPNVERTTNPVPLQERLSAAKAQADTAAKAAEKPAAPVAAARSQVTPESVKRDPATRAAAAQARQAAKAPPAAPAASESTTSKPTTTRPSPEPVLQLLPDVSQPEPTQVRKYTMAIDISKLQEIGGFIGAAVVDSDSGMMLASLGGGASFDLEIAAAANSEVVKAKLRAMQALGLNDAIEDILISLGTQYHLIRPMAKNPAVFIYVAVDRKTANLALARGQVKAVEGVLKVA